MQEAVNAEREHDKGEERPGLVRWAFAFGVGHGREQAAVDEGFDRQPEEGAAVGVLVQSWYR